MTDTPLIQALQAEQNMTNTDLPRRLQAEKELPDLISKLDIKPIDPDLDLDSQRRLKEKIGKEYAQSEKNRYVKLSDKLQKTIINDALLSVIFSGILFISGIAILLRKNWGRILFLSTITMRLLFNLIQLAMSKIHIDPTPGAIALHIVVPVIIVAGSFFLLARPNNDFNSYSSPEV